MQGLSTGSTLKQRVCTDILTEFSLHLYPHGVSSRLPKCSFYKKLVGGKTTITLLQNDDANVSLDAYLLYVKCPLLPPIQ